MENNQNKKGIKDMHELDEYDGIIDATSSYNDEIRVHNSPHKKRRGKHTIQLKKSPKKKRGSVDARSKKTSNKKYLDIIPPQPGFVKRHSKKTIMFLATVVFVFVLYTLLIGYKSYMLHSTQNAFEKLLTLKDLWSTEEIRKQVDRSHNTFVINEILFAPFGLVLDTPLYSHPDVANARNLIAGGKHLTGTFTKFVDIVDTVTEDYGNSVRYPTALLEKQKRKIASVQKSLKKTNKHFGRLDELPISSEMYEKFVFATDALKNAEQWINTLLDNFDTFLNMLGHDAPKQYMVLNQNKDELRASGGFPGSVITFAFDKGHIKNFVVDDVYLYDWLRRNIKNQPAPEGLGRVNSQGLELHDANYYPVFEESAKTINTLYNEATGKELDVLVAIHQGLIEDFLQKYGSVVLDNVDIEITAENFSALMSIMVESKYFKETQSPKDILVQFVKQVQDIILEEELYTTVAEVIAKHILSGELLVGSTNEDIQNFLEELHIFEAWRAYEGDFVYPIFTSIGGNKTDRYMSRLVEIETNACLRNVHFLQTYKPNTWDKIQIDKAFFEAGVTNFWDKRRILDIQLGTYNRQFIRIVVPKGSQIQNNAKGEVWIDTSYEDFDILNWYQTTKLHSTSVIDFSYTVSEEYCEKTPKFFKQPGLEDITYNVQ